MFLYLGSKLGLGSGLAAFAGTFSTIGDAVGVEIEDVRRLGTDLRIDARLVT